MASAQVGARRRRIEDPRLLVGAGPFVDDVQEAGCLHAVFVRSPHAHARVVSVESGAALALPGVVAVFAAGDLPNIQTPTAAPAVPNARIAAGPPLAAETVRYVGEPIALVVAESRYLAEDAAGLVEVEYEPLPAVASAEAALAPDAPWLHLDVPNNVCFREARTYGDVDAAFAAAAHRVSVRLVHQRIAPVSIEPRGLLARPTAAGGLVVSASTQTPHGTRAGLARSLGLAEEAIRVSAPEVGGGFGAKGGTYREDVVVAAAALRLQRPVKWVATRIEDLLTMQHARDQVDVAEAALDRDGTILALRIRTIGTLGAYAHRGNGALLLRVAAFGTGAYRIAALEAETVAVYTNTNPIGAYRGAGRPEAAFMIERVVDAAARQLGIDPVELRRRNLVRPEEFPYTNPWGTGFDSGNWPALLDAALRVADYESLEAERDRRRARGELVGIGLALFIEQTGAGAESGRVRVEADGTVSAVTGSSSQGQGHRTMFAQVVADQFGVPFEQVRVLQGDTALIPSGVGTFGSRSTVVGGGALVSACRETIAMGLALAARELETSASDLEWVAGRARVRGAPERSLDLAQLATLAEAAGQGRLEASATFDGGTGPTSAGAYVALVSIDRDTGRLRVERFVAVDDCGVVINPMLVEGQVHGALAQGFGEALAERVVYDEQGQVLTGSLAEYAVPIAPGLPGWTTDRTETPSPLHPLGAKGMGEAGTIGAPPALVNAALDALSPLGVRELRLPLDHEQLWRAIRDAETPAT